MSTQQPVGRAEGYLSGPGSSESFAADEHDPEVRRAFDDVLAAIRVHGEELASIPNVVSVRPGYRYRGAKLILQPVVAVTVLRKLDPSALRARDLIPARLGKVLVDVRPATPREQLNFLNRQQNAGLAGAQAPAAEVDTRLPREMADDFGGAAANFAGLEPYVPPDTPLEEVEEEMTVVCHASPDAGWRNLRNFIEGTEQKLVSTMYEFNARYILTALSELASPRRLHLILDGGSPNAVPGPPASTVSKRAARRQLENSLDNRFECVWAPVADDGMTTVAFFPSAYHTKVSVRDGNSFWLSSGNWKSSGQPEIDPINGPFPPGFNKSVFLNNHNREWHVIVHNEGLADTFEAFISHDIEQATPLQQPAPAPPEELNLPDLFVPEGGPAAFAAFAEAQFFGEEEFTKRVRVQPLMTPDNYPEHILPLIRNATRTLYFQNQSLKPSASNARYMPLFRALRDKTRETLTNPDLDVRILVSEYTDLEVLADWNFEMSCVRRQYECHNKGIIVDDVDGEVVVVGSHNWTGQGATQNRDASLIFHDEEIAAYFKRIFLYDWERVGETDALLLAMPLVAAPGEPTPPGMVRVAWHDVFPDWRDEEL